MDIKKFKKTIQETIDDIETEISGSLSDLSIDIENIVQGYKSEFQEITKKEKEIEKTKTKAKIEFAKHLLSKQGYSEHHKAYFVSVRVIEEELKDLEEHERLLEHRWTAHAFIYANGERGRRRFT